MYFEDFLQEQRRHDEQRWNEQNLKTWPSEVCYFGSKFFHMSSTENHPYIIVLGNEKGGTGKSTVAMHLIVSLLRDGYTVGSIDADARQGTLTRYIENRQLRLDTRNENIPISEHLPIFRSTFVTVPDQEEDEINRLAETIDRLSHNNFIVIDTPGSDTFLSRLAHSYADTLITPINDSFIDLDMLVRVSPDNLDILRPSTYSEMVWDQKKKRMMRDQGVIDWIVLRNRLSSARSRNKEDMDRILKALSKRIGFRLSLGFGERVIFREMFLMGLTIFDMRAVNIPMTLSHLSAKQEMAELMKTIQIPVPKKKNIPDAPAQVSVIQSTPSATQSIMRAVKF